MNYFGASVNEQPVIAEKAGALIANGAGKGVKYDTNGNVVLAAAGDAVCGVLIMQTPAEVPAGDDVTIQIKDIGYVLAGGTFKKGDALATNADGAFIKATGKACARALEDGAAGKYVHAHVCIVPTV